KPANILLDEQNEPHVTDFGLARNLQNDSGLTATGDILGTPGYMSPEQARGDRATVGPASDIYSLGALLYCLLTARPPFQAPTVMETLFAVMNTEPIPPSQLTPGVPRDLETIAVRCLQKQRHHRYATAQELADELDRYLAGRPILARPVGSIGRFIRWCRRRPVQATLSLLLVGVTVLGFSGIVWQWRKSAENYRIAQDNFIDSQLNLAEANHQRTEAEANFSVARKTVQRILTVVPNHELMQRPGMEPVKLDLQKLACEYYQVLADRDLTDPALKLEQGQAHFFYAMTLDDVGDADAALEQYQLAETAILDAEQRQQAKGKASDFQQRIQQNLAAVHGNIGGLLMLKENYQEALSVFQKILDRQQLLMTAHPESLQARLDVVLTLSNMSFAYRSLRQFEDALKQNRQALDVIGMPMGGGVPDLSPDTLLAVAPSLHLDVAFIEYELGDFASALMSYEHAVTCSEELVHGHPDQLELCHIAGLANRGLAQQLHELGRNDDAETHWERTLELHSHAHQLAPDVQTFRQTLADSCILCAAFRNDVGHPESAFLHAVEGMEAAAGDSRKLFQLATVIAQSIAVIDATASEADDVKDVNQDLRQRCVESATEALRMATDPGGVDPGLLTHEAFAPLQNHPAFQSLLKHLQQQRDGETAEPAATDVQ
ncbi:MAG: protein kinase, partial [Planctomycetaceae bacterium]|nr:protein kinase [Planctomycetaceae bacterium]